MRKKTQQPMDASNVTNAWQAFFECNKVDDDAQLRIDGWLDIYTVAKKINRAVCTIAHNPEGFGLDSRIFKVSRNGRIRDVRYCRPK